MIGTVRVEVPAGCQNCDFFQVIEKNKLIIKYGYCNEEEVNGACHCILDKSGHRLKPLDNGEVMEEKATPTTTVEYDEETDELYEVKGVNYETKTYRGRPDWCAIHTGEWV